VPYKPPSTLITFRTSPASAAKLQDLANKIGASRSMLTVLLLQAALNDGQIISKIKDLYGSRSRPITPPAPSPRSCAISARMLAPTRQSWPPPPSPNGSSTACSSVGEA
jgi:hypothetical protein